LGGRVALRLKDAEVRVQESNPELGDESRAGVARFAERSFNHSVLRERVSWSAPRDQHAESVGEVIVTSPDGL